MLEQMQVHQYYLLPVLALAIFPVLNGIKWITDTRKTSVLYFILLLMPATAMIRILPARWMKEDLGIPAGFANSANLEQLINAVPSEEKVITVPDESGCIWLYFYIRKASPMKTHHSLLQRMRMAKSFLKNTDEEAQNGFIS